MNIRYGLDLINENTYGSIYITTNIINNKRYIGQKRVKTQSPWKDYIGSGKLIKRAIEKYGKDNFFKDIVEVCDNQDELDEREKYWIAYYDAVADERFYNLCPGGKGANYWCGLTKEEQDELKLVHQKKSQHGENNHCAILTEDQVKEAIRLLLDGKTAKDVSDLTGIPVGNVLHIRRKDTWKELTENITFPQDIYVNLPDDRADSSNRVEEISYNKISDINIIRYRAKIPILQYDSYGHFVARYDDINDVTAQYGKEKKNKILRNCRHKSQSAYGSIWFFEDDIDRDKYLADERLLERCQRGILITQSKRESGTNKKACKPVKQYDAHMCYIKTFPSVGDAAKAVNGRISCVSTAITNRRVYKGYFWILANEELNDSA